MRALLALPLLLWPLPLLLTLPAKDLAGVRLDKGTAVDAGQLASEG